VTHCRSQEKINYSVAERRVKGVASDLSGNLWISLGISDTCLLKINQNDTIAFTQQNSPLLIREVLTDPNFCFDKKGNTWITSKSGLYKYDGTNWQRFTPENSPLRNYQINDLAIDKDDNLWGAAGGAGGREEDETNGCLFKYDGTDWTIYTGKNSGLPSGFVASIAFDSKNNLWINCRESGAIGREQGYGLTKFDGVAWTTYNINNSGLSSNSILDIVCDKEDNVWMATYGRVGITKYDGTSWQSYNVGNSGIAFDEVSKITFDYYRDLIWLNHLFSGGLSTAKLNSSTAIPNILANKESFDIYPNPAKTTVSFRFNGDFVPETVQVYEISGQLICQKNLNTLSRAEYTTTLAGLNINRAGLYLVKIIGKGGKVHIRKLLATQ
jgi:streptogramin lyase